VPRVLLTAFGGLLIATAMGRPLGAQERSLVELGVTGVRFPADSLVTGGPSVRLSRSHERDRLTVTGSASAIAGIGGASGFGELAGRWLGPSLLGWRGEVSAEVGALLGTGGRSSSVTSSGSMAARLVRSIDAGGVWLRGGASLSPREPDRLFGHGLGAGAWWRWSATQIVASLARERNVAQLFTGAGREGYAGTVPVAYTEGALGMQVERDDAILSMHATVRRDPGAERLFDRGLSATAVLWQTPVRAMVVSVASQLPDFVHGADAAQSFTVGIRLGEPSPRTARARRARPVVQVSGDSAARTVRVRAPGATRVEIMGDFSEWEAVALSAAGDAFSASLPMAPGVRRILVRVDGGSWAPAANTPALDDDFGGRVGLLLVP